MINYDNLKQLQEFLDSRIVRNNIRKVRRSKGLTQIFVSKALHISSNSLHSWEMNVSQPKATKLVDIADILGVSLDDLISRNESKYKRKWKN